MEILVAARVLQGGAGGGILAAGLGSVGRAFPSGSRAYPRDGVFGGQPVGAGVTVGPLGRRGTGGGGRLARWVLGRGGGRGGA